MTPLTVIAGALALGLAAYLVFALLFPEKLS
ncbi:K(+)-transporting ATPase subunit F [Anaeromyxobacter terrae]|nr:K(+)-transporting ATPase subunit F [Anaeromyxobacter sp. SG22]